ncbi:branched-chain amino acid transport system ATP-binding protein [Saccharothrix ecbatanensis]|uniref:Branched-chain amino acid transport system ATP-binding protein n=1 Tax=Saccharothrix ecbatanensis TaxID=1105145 RepID=A0A7W9HJM9_9PSEU|nr:ABC transporter ATP-binding protein [Saccharothrix ecbatanensis]MBB5803507.1 branched-chain amino acid transport system ATP-binding protein [Saccharothrix ecbatanensis]
MTSVVQVRAVTVAFGGLRALSGIDLDIAQGERLAILGPNGAGKTTLFNVIAGDIAPTAGAVVIRGQDCTHRPSRHRPRLGLARTYQKARAFAGLTVRENIYLAIAGRRGRHRALWPSSVDRRLRDEAAEVAARVWLSGQLDAVAGELAHGQRRQLELAMAIAAQPDVLLLDEPASGLSRGERERLVELLESLDDRLTLLLIEHDMDIAFRIAQRVVVMADGVQVMAGSPEQVRADPHVHRIYLGTEATA